MLRKIEAIKKECQLRLSQVSSMEELNEFKIKTLGRKGEVTLLLRGLKDLSGEEKARAGRVANELKQNLEQMLKEKIEAFKLNELEQRLLQEKIDVTLPGLPRQGGRQHPLTQITQEIQEIFIGMGFTIAEGPEIESDYYNFEALNVPGIIRPGICRIPSTSVKSCFCEPILRRYR